MILKREILALLIGLYIFSALFNLGRMYFQHEEPRRAIIALEMNYTRNYVVPHVLGRPYFKKPPLHNIVVAAFFKILGSNEFAARLVSVLSMFGIAFLIYLVSKDIIGFEASVFAAFSFGLSIIAYFQYGRLAETDMFFSFLLFASMVCIFKNRIILGSFFTALALLTKGFPALHYFYLTLFFYLLINEQIKRIFSKEIFIGGFLIVFLFLGWLLFVSKGNIHRFNYALGFLINASGSRVLSITHFGSAVVHFLKFPVNFLIHFLPSSMFLLFFANKYFRDGFVELIRSNSEIKKLFKFSLAAFIPNFLIYAIVPDGRIRYTLVLFAIFSFFVGIVYYQLEYDNLFDFKRLFKFLFVVAIVVSLIAFVFNISFSKSGWLMPNIFAFVLSLIGFILTGRMFKNCCADVIVLMVLFVVSFKFLYDSTYMSHLYTYYTNYREKGRQAAEIILQHHPDYVMSNGGNLRFFFYLERDLGMQIHPIKSNKNGIVVSKNGNILKKIFAKIELPDHIYYIGEK
ncbi:glycosyltransferase family 39 protein [Hippea alviniae]|uniref:glycosyltransferase family 39 protein n=1 Tax=Hippea alviniae TaxID=1279027 RepID=UPI0003B51C45|nr:glycosyltransferase family 39 protein [Hippea alviniae]